MLFLISLARAMNAFEKEKEEKRAQREQTVINAIQSVIKCLNFLIKENMFHVFCINISSFKYISASFLLLFTRLDIDLQFHLMLFSTMFLLCVEKLKRKRNEMKIIRKMLGQDKEKSSEGN